MPSNLKRYHDFGHDHFVTFSCYHRLPYLNDDPARIVFLDTLETLRQRHLFDIYGYVLMPEHVHLLLSEPPELTFNGIFRALKPKLQTTETKPAPLLAAQLLRLQRLHSS